MVRKGIIVLLAAVIGPGLIESHAQTPAGQVQQPSPQAQQPGAAAPTVAPTGAAPRDPVVMRTRRVLTKEAGLTDILRIEVDGLAEAVRRDTLNEGELVLYLNGRPVPGVPAARLNPDSNLVDFRLQRTAESRDVWNELLGRPTSAFRRARAGVGIEGKGELPQVRPADLTFSLRLFHRGWFVFALIVFTLGIVLFWRRAKTGTIIRDSNPPLVPGNQKPFSLAKFQMALWFFAVMGSFLFIYLITHDYNILTPQALILIGIGTGTALGAAIVGDSKQTGAANELHGLAPQISRMEAEVQGLAAGAPAPGTPEYVLLAERRAQLQELREKEAEITARLNKPVSTGFWDDILTDANGVGFHRFQMVAWTMILVGIFLWEVYLKLAMPAFSDTLLLLMGISSGTYLGFKIPERQTGAQVLAAQPQAPKPPQNPPPPPP